MLQAVLLGACTSLPPSDSEIVGPHLGKPPPRGADVLRGVLEIVGVDAVGAATRLAVAEALAGVVHRFAPKGGRASIEVTRSPLRPGTSTKTLRFAFTLRATSPTAVALAHAALEREAANGGRQRLLPRFAQALKAHGEAEAAAAGDLLLSDFAIEALTVPGKGEGGGADFASLACAEGADTIGSVISCLSGQCGTEPMQGASPERPVSLRPADKLDPCAWAPCSCEGFAAPSPARSSALPAAAWLAGGECLVVL